MHDLHTILLSNRFRTQSILLSSHYQVSQLWVISLNVWNRLDYGRKDGWYDVRLTTSILDVSLFDNSVIIFLHLKIWICSTPTLSGSLDFTPRLLTLNTIAMVLFSPAGGWWYLMKEWTQCYNQDQNSWRYEGFLICIMGRGKSACIVGKLW